MRGSVSAIPSSGAAGRYYLYIYIRTAVSNYEREVLTLIRNLILITTIVLRVASSETVSFLVIDDTGNRFPAGR